MNETTTMSRDADLDRVAREHGMTRTVTRSRIVYRDPHSDLVFHIDRPRRRGLAAVMAVAAALLLIAA